MSASYGTVLPLHKDKKSKHDLPRPLVKPYKHPVVWAKQKLAMTVARAVLAYVGVLAVAGLYYLLFETWAPMTNLWHEAVSDSALRHNIRDVGEGLLGGLLGIMVVLNFYLKKFHKKPNLLDKLEMKLHIPNIKDNRPFSGIDAILVIPLVLLYAIPGFFIGEALVSLFHHLAPSIHELAGEYKPSGHATGIFEKMKNNFTESWPKKLIGFLAAFIFGRRPATAVFADMQLWFAERRCALGKGVSWYHMPTFKARYYEVCEGSGSAVEASPKQSALMVGGVFVLFLLACFGFYVLNFIAQ